MSAIEYSENYVSQLLLNHGYRYDEAKEILKCMNDYYQMKARHRLRLYDLNDE
ncbi:MAG: hypothetical protein K0R02_696 [Rickettsiaceae bacterium]|jgi:hypothetical protein|nr:hypothetical protein [Rickettsiaceae bacterium]